MSNIQNNSDSSENALSRTELTSRVPKGTFISCPHCNHGFRAGDGKVGRPSIFNPTEELTIQQKRKIYRERFVANVENRKPRAPYKKRTKIEPLSETEQKS